MATLDEVKKLKASWEHQKNNKLKEARICDAYIHAFGSVIQLIEQEEKAKAKKSEKGFNKPAHSESPSTE